MSREERTRPSRSDETPPGPHPTMREGLLTLVDDPARVAATSRLLPRSAAYGSLDQLADLAAHLLGAPSAQISLLTTAQTVAGGWGLGENAKDQPTPLEDSLCTLTASSGAPRTR